MDELRIPGLPFPLRWLDTPGEAMLDGDELRIAAGARTDWFVDPGGEGAPVLNAAALVAPVEGDFLLHAHVRPELAATYDAGVLALWLDEHTWAKLCLELSPQGVPTVVSVVTRGVSDDCNSTPAGGEGAWLRVARLGPAFAFHASTDGATWQLVRYFALPVADAIRLGFQAQSPTGEGCAATFTQVGFRADRLAELRDGS
jgi:uncharacterized protein